MSSPLSISFTANDSVAGFSSEMPHGTTTSTTRQAASSESETRMGATPGARTTRSVLHEQEPGTRGGVSWKVDVSRRGRFKQRRSNDAEGFVQPGPAGGHCPGQ